MSSYRVKLRRGTTAETSVFTGEVGEVTVDTTKKTLVVHDGATRGGHPLPRDTDVKTDLNQLTDNYGLLQSYVDGFTGSTEVYAITVAPDSSGNNNVFYITGLENPHIVLTPGNRYIFDVSDSSNTGHPLYFTADDGTTNYTTGVSRIGTEGTPGAKIIFIIPADVPALKYYCSVHGLSMGNQISSVLNTPSSGGSSSLASFDISPALPTGETSWNLATDGDLSITEAGNWTFTATTDGTVDLSMKGAGGGYGKDTNSLGGNGGETSGTISVTSGDTFVVTVGSKGVQSGGAGTYGGGGAGGNLTLPGSGGGYSGIFEGAEQQSKSILIAGGGGGGHGWDAGSATGNGGSGGGTDGTAGTAGSSGGGATQTGGGAGAGNGTSGTPLTGGTGGNRSTNQGSGGGGGGGYFGGGGGAAGSYNGNQNGTPGGGGSGYIGGTANFAVTDGVTTAGAGSTTEVDGTFSMVGQVATTEETPTVATPTIISNSYGTVLHVTTDGEAGVNSSFIDSSSNAATVTAGGTPQLNTFSPYRHGGYSTHFDGNAEMRMPANLSSIGTGDFTMECWIKTGVKTNYQSIMGCFTGTSPGSDIGPWLHTNNVGVILGSDYDMAYASGSTDVCDNNWHHIALVRSSGTITIYVDGTADGTLSHNQDLSTLTSDIVLGDLDGYNRPFTGSIADARITTSALYTEAFTPPTERLAAVDGTESLTCNLPYFADSSSNSATITTTGNVSSEPFSPYDHIGYIEATNGGSVYFDGTEWLQVGHNSIYDIYGSADGFTVEGWIYPEQWANTEYGDGIVCKNTSNSGWIVRIGQDGKLQFVHPALAGSGPLGVPCPINTWTHFAFTRTSAGDWNLYQNGVNTQTFTLSGTTNRDTSNDIYIGREVSQPSAYFKGYISDVKISNTVLYSTDFAAPTSVMESTDSLLHIKGVEGHIIDKAQSGIVLELGGNVAAATGTEKYSTSNIVFDGSGDYIRIPYSDSIMRWWDNDYTMEYWIRPSAFGESAPADSKTNFMTHGDIGGTTDYWSMGPRANGTVEWFWWSGTTNRFSTTTALSVDTWHHLAFTYEKATNTATIYIDGVESGSATVSNTPLVDSSYPLNIGHGPNGAAFDGRIEDFRISNRLVYTENFTVPDAALESPQTTGGGAYIVATGGTITTDGNYKYHTFTEDGTFSITSVGTNATVDVLAVGGGGAGGGSSDSNSGGGGAGGYLEGSITAEVQSYDIVIGQGGIGGVADVGTSGGDTTISVLNATAIGGGYGGGGARSLQTAGAQGGSGGGGGGFPNDMAGGAGVQGDSGGLTGYGNAGGSVGSYSSDGGGGASQPGGTNANSAGGDGRQWLDGNYYAGGGSGGAGNLAGGLGGGGAGSNGSGNGANATANTGGGGGGSYASGSGSSSTGGNGGSGVVIFRYPYQGTVTETAPTSTSYRYMKVVLNSVSSGTQAQVTEISFTGENGATDFITGQTITNWYGTGSTATSQSPTIALVNNAQSPAQSEHTNLETLPFTLEYDLGASYVHGTQLRYLQLGSSDSNHRYPTSVTVYGATQPDFSDEVALITNSTQAYASMNSNTLIDLGTSITGGSAGSATFSDLLTQTLHPINVYDDTREQRETTNAFSGTHSLYINFAGSTRRSPQDTSGYTYTDYTISFWARMESWNTYNGTRINWLTNGPKYQESNSHGDGAIYVVDNSNEVGFVTQRYNGSIYHYVSGTASSSFATDAWYHFVVTGDATNNTATLTVSSDGGTFGDMINASTFTTGNQVATLTPQNLYLAGSSGNAANGTHQIRYDLYGIWDRVLDVTERQAVFDAGATHDHPNLPTSGLKLYYTFDDDYNNYSNS